MHISETEILEHRKELISATLRSVFALTIGCWLSFGNAEARPLKTSHIETNCLRVMNQTLELYTKELSGESELLDRRLQLSESERWLPKSPQLRTRFERSVLTSGLALSKPRLGLRWAMPSFGGPKNSALALFEVDRLVDRWREAREANIMIDAAMRHLNFRERWLVWAKEEGLAQIAQEELSRAKILFEAGSLTQSQLRRAELRQERVMLKSQTSRKHLRRAVSEMSENAHHIVFDLRASPLKDQCIQSFELPELGIEQTKRPPSIAELSIITQLRLDATEAQSFSGRWIDFVELSYDDNQGDQRLIAEFGFDLPWGNRSLEKNEISMDRRLRKLFSLKAELDRSLKALWASLSEDERGASVPLPYPPSLEDSKLIDLLERAEALELWSLQWLARLEREKLILEWLKLHYHSLKIYVSRE